MQKSRVLGYGLTFATALATHAIHGLDAKLSTIILIGIVNLFWSYCFLIIERRQLDTRWGVNLSPIWMATDLINVCVGVYVSGGLSSPWYLFFFSNSLAASFVSGWMTAVVIGVASIVSYLGTLWALDQLHDAGLGIAVGRMMILYAAVFFAIKGIDDLKRKRLQVKRLRDDEARKVAELTRLTQALDERTQALGEANARIRESDRLKSRFLANMSHELRTPLNSIIGFSEILRNRLPPDGDPKQARFLANIHSSGTHLLGLINDILDLSKIEAGRVHLSPEAIAIGPLLDGVIAVMKGVASEKLIQFEVEVKPGLPGIDADPGKLKQILYNLLSNAVKFSPSGSTVNVRVQPLSAEASGLGVDAIGIEVVDQGIGIDPQHHELVFQEFRQVDGSPAREFQGTGLGLALVKKFVELHRGRVAVESQLGRGCTMKVMLPCVFRGSGEVPIAQPMPVADGRPLVLVVEDDPTVFDRIDHVLSAGGYRLLRARDGIEALRYAKSLKPAAITLDLVLPGMGGWDVLRRLKEEEGTRDIPVVIISVVDQHELGAALGADGYFVKPPNGAALLKRVQELAPSRGRPQRLLVVDDDPATHEILDGLLSPHGFLVESATSGVEALDRVSARRPDLIILDLLMPEMDGFEVATRLRAEPATATIPILVLTSKDLSRAEHDRLRGHVGGLIRKGEASPASLLSVLERILGGAHA